MLKIKKMTAVLLSVVMLMCCFAVTASAESIADNAKAISSGKSYSTKLYKSGETLDYKIKVSKSGELKLNITSQMREVDVYLYDTKGNTIGALDLQAKTGTTTWAWDGYVYCVWNSTVEKYSGSFKYSVDKGTYYLRLKRSGSAGSEKVSFKATFPSSSSSSSTETKADAITVPMKKGATMQLAFNADDVKWTTSDKTIVTVTDSGKITAKKAGTAVITAKSDSGTAKLKIKVTK